MTAEWLATPAGQQELAAWLASQEDDCDQAYARWSAAWSHPHIGPVWLLNQGLSAYGRNTARRTNLQPHTILTRLLLANGIPDVVVAGLALQRFARADTRGTSWEFLAYQISERLLQVWSDNPASEHDRYLPHELPASDEELGLVEARALWEHVMASATIIPRLHHVGATGLLMAPWVKRWPELTAVSMMRAAAGDLLSWGAATWLDTSCQAVGIEYSDALAHWGLRAVGHRARLGDVFNAILDVHAIPRRIELVQIPEASAGSTHSR